MGRFHRNAGTLADLKVEHLVAPGYTGGSRNHDPMFAALMVHLQRQPAPWFHRHTLDLVAGTFLEDCVGTPGPLDGYMLQMFLRTLLPEQLHHFFHILGT